MRLQPGDRLGVYEIVSVLGAGGMGEVYRARDSRLERDVAIKVLPERLAADPQALSRFTRESKAVAALSHPNILAIYDVGAENGVSFAVMELLEGETLRNRLRQGAIPWRKAVEIATAVADGLAVAHAKRIVHRDLKPENIFLSFADHVKILDFGLARVNPDVPAQDDASSIPTETRPGTVLGTAGYMSPEQLRGEPVKATSDVFSLGCILYEMLAGRRAFVRDTAAQTMAAILEAQPPELGGTAKLIPAELDRLVTHCLEKNPQQRFQSAHDLGFALGAILGTSSPAALRPHSNRLRGIWIPAALAVLVAGISFYWFHSSERAIDSLAVLPFVNAAGDPNTEYLSDGITETLINSLSQLKKLRVTARSLAFRYKGSQTDPQKAGRDLQVRAVLTGRVVERGGTLNIQAELMNVEDGSQLWGNQYSRKFSDILNVQEDIAREVSGKLHLKPAAEQQKRMAKRPTEDADVYQAYLRGRYYWNRRTDDALKRAVAYFQQAIDKDPGYARAYAGLADCYAAYAIYQVESPLETGPKVKAAAARALEIDSTLAEPHSSLAMTKMNYEWDWAGAEREFQRSAEIDPNNATAQSWYSLLLTATARPEPAAAALKRAHQLDPLSMSITASAGLELFYGRRYDEAIEQGRKALEMDPNFAAGHWFLGRPYEQKAMYPEAIAEFQKAVELSGGSPATLAFLGHAYALSGNSAKARRVLADLSELSKHRYVSPYDSALIYTGLREKERALEWLEKASEDRSWEMVWLRVDPRFDSLRADARFADLLRRMRLTP